jgi:aryl-alcohol dehydrogenase-like predicted oxidoreductase
MWAYQFSMMQHVAELHGWTKFISMQNHHSLCYREEEREMNPFCLESGVGLMAWSPLYGGLLARPLGYPATKRQEAAKTQPTPEDGEIIDAVQEIAERKGWTMTQVALVWLVQKNSTPIVGISSLERLSEAINIRGKKLTLEETSALEKAYKPKVIIGLA